MAPFSGPTPTNGLDLLQGARLAADEINQSGGAAGHRIELLAVDELNPTAAADVVADPDVVAVVGHLLPGWPAAAATYRAAGLAWLAAEPVAAEESGPSMVYPLVAAPAVVRPAVAGYLATRGQPEPAVAAGQASRSPYVGLGYDGVELVGAAAAEAAHRGPITRAALRAALFAPTQQGTLGTFGPTGVQAAIAEVREGYPGVRLALAR